MRRIGHVATYPARIDTLPAMLESIASQLDEVRVVLNEYAPSDVERLPNISNVTYERPGSDLKDTGKFLWPGDDEDYVFLLDDDIVFPPSYAETLIRHYEQLPGDRVVVGMHGTVYSDLFDGAATSRFVMKFDRALQRPLLVNQLGTGCCMIRGGLLPAFDQMKTAQRFVDIRFAAYCHRNGIAMVCLPREDGWLTDLGPEDSIFASYTLVQQDQHTKEVLTFGGFGKLDTSFALALERQ